MDGIELNIVVAYQYNNYGIGLKNSIPWYIPEDLKYFKLLTTPKYNEYSFVIMGSKTWDSINDKYKPLKNRINIVLSNNIEYKNKQEHKYSNLNLDGNTFKTGIYFYTLDEFIKNRVKIEEFYKNSINQFRNSNSNDYIKMMFNYYVIGGETIYEQFMNYDININIYATEIYTEKSILEYDKYIKISNTFTIEHITEFYKSDELQHYNGNSFNIWFRYIKYNNYKRFNYNYSSEILYLELMRRIIDNGQVNIDRTGIGTLSLFGEMLKYNLRDTFPISTTKKIFFRAIFEELMLYLSGKTDNKILNDKGITVWDGNTSRDFLDKRGLNHYEVGDMGQTYGFNMRHYGAKYLGCKYEYSDNYGYDQLMNVIHLIKNDPYSRRIIIDLWDPSTIDNAALPSCLCKYQFNVNVDKKELNLAIYLRSSDYFLANNWNTCTGALFVHLLCNLNDINLSPGDLTVFIADAHIYKNHIDQVKINLSRNPYPYPKLLFKCNKQDSILNFKFDDLLLLGYKSHPSIKADMAI